MDEDDHHDDPPQPPTTTTTKPPPSFMGDDATTPCATTASTTLPLVFHPGRYKKLRKRATMKASPIHPSSGNSGITTLNDWYELVQLHKIHYEQQQQQQQHPSAQPPKKKKRKQQEPPPPPPTPQSVVANKTIANEPQLPGIQILQPLPPQMHENTPYPPPPHPPLLEDGTNNEPGARSSQPNIMDAVRHQKFLLHRLIHVLLQKQPPVPPTSYPSSLSSPNHPQPRMDIDSNHHHSMTRVVSVHNPMAIGHVVLLEIHVTTQQEAESMIQFIVDHSTHHSNAVVLPTTWFHTNGTEPRSITDAVMYEKTYHPHQQHQQRRHHSKITSPRRDGQETIITVEDLYHLLKPFVLSVLQWEKENYPLWNQRLIPPPEEDKNTTSSPLGSNQVTMMELNEARQFIRPYEIHVDDDEATTGISRSDNRDHILQNEPSSLLPFVGHCHPREMVGQPQMKAKCNNDDTPSETNEPSGRRIFAIDCEMVETAMGKELARVTVCELISLTFDPVPAKTESVTSTSETIPMKAEVRLDTVVQPYNRITNYLTRYSGISASTYLDADSGRILRLEQVQAILLQLIHPRDIVIGHSLENDLYALRFLHPTVVDTAIMFQQQNRDHDNHRIAAATSTIRQLLSKSPSSSTTTRTFKYSLLHLAAVLLHKEIQSASGPHCSVEDAVTALQLAVSRAIRGPSFGISHKGNSSNWFTKLSNHSKDAITAVAVGPVKWLRQHILSPSSSNGNAIHALQCETIDDINSKAIARWVTGPTRRASVVWSKMELSPDNHNALTTRRMSEWVQDVITKLSSNNSVVLMIPIQINYSDTKELHQQRQLRRSNPRSTIPWSESDEKLYQTSLEICRNGYVLYITNKG